MTLSWDDPERPHPHIEALVEELAVHAGAILAEDPDLPLVALVVERRGPWFRPFAAAIEEANGRPSKGEWAAGVVDRAPVFAQLEADGGEDAWLFIAKCDEPGSKLLPVVVAGRAGYRLGWTDPTATDA